MTAPDAEGRPGADSRAALSTDPERRAEATVPLGSDIAAQVHVVTWERHPEKPSYRRAACSCGWATRWSFYTDSSAGPAAVRHATGLDLRA